MVDDAAGSAKNTHDIRGECLKLLCRTPGVLALLFAVFYGLLVTADITIVLEALWSRTATARDLRMHEQTPFWPTMFTPMYAGNFVRVTWETAWARRTEALADARRIGDRSLFIGAATLLVLVRLPYALAGYVHAVIQNRSYRKTALRLAQVGICGPVSSCRCMSGVLDNILTMLLPASRRPSIFWPVVMAPKVLSLRPSGAFYANECIQCDLLHRVVILLITRNHVGHDTLSQWVTKSGVRRCDWGVNNALAGQPSNGSRAYRDRDLSQLGQDLLTEFWAMEGRTVEVGDASGVAARWLFDGHTVGEQRRIAPLSHLAAARLVSSTFATRLWEATQPRCVLRPRLRGLHYGLSKLHACVSAGQYSTSARPWSPAHHWTPAR